jgi:hypothetical protein
MSGVCQSCGVEAPTQKVMFVQHIGAIVMFFHKRIGGEFCRTCVSKYFRQYGLTTLLAGWWGMISVFATPVVLVIDVVNYFRAWNLPPVPADARYRFRRMPNGVVVVQQPVYASPDLRPTGQDRLTQ